MRRQHQIRGEDVEQYGIKNFRFDSTSSSGPSLRLIVPEKNPYITAVEPEDIDGMVKCLDQWVASKRGMPFVSCFSGVQIFKGAITMY